MQDFELEMTRYQVENQEKWKEIIKEIPTLNFKKEWNIRIIPPFGGAMARFVIEYNNKSISVYLDFYDRLGVVWQPYYEMYDGANTIRYYLNESDEMMNDIDKVLNGKPIEEL